MNDVKVSVVMPVYNVDKYLRQCLDSIVNQTLKEIEIICINDGSKDNSLEILREYEKKDSRFHIVDKQNEGVSRSRNLGVEIAKGEYISFIDSDDWIDKEYLMALYAAAKKYDSDIACSSIIRVSNKKRRNKLIYTQEEFCKDSNEKNEITKVPLHSYVWNKIYKREALIKNELQFPVGRVYEDIIWSIKAVYYLNGVVTVPSATYFYRKNPTSIMSTKSKQNAIDCALAEKEMLEFAKEKNLKLLDGYKYVRRDRFRFCGITLMKRFYYYPDVTEYCLLGLIPIYRCTTKSKK